eukprot:Hpha_TRINITY_DN13405_c0_g2::TRINITY_DN13405_c0_g2_i1::g.130980::m.130980
MTLQNFQNFGGVTTAVYPTWQSIVTMPQAIAQPIHQTVPQTVPQTVAPQAAVPQTLACNMQGIQTMTLPQTIMKFQDVKAMTQMIPVHTMQQMVMPAATLMPAMTIAAPQQALPQQVPQQVPQQMTPPTPPTPASVQTTTPPRTPSPPGERQVRILLLKNVSVGADLTRLFASVNSTFAPATIQRWLAVWAKGCVLLEMSDAVSINGRMRLPRTRGVTVEACDRQTLETPPPQDILNAKFFILHPHQDCTGGAEERAAYEETKKTWSKGKAGADQGMCSYEFLGNELEHFGGEQWTEVMLPHYSRHVSSHHVVSSQRMFTQFVFRFQDAVTARRVMEKADGKTFRLGKLSIVIRLDFADPQAISLAPRVPNAALFSQDGENDMPMLLEEC